MSAWYLTKIKYTLQDEQGKQKAVSEAYLIDAVSYTEAEARLFGFVAANIPDFQVTGITKMRLQEVFFVEEGAETWFKVKVNYLLFDEKTQKEKKVPYQMLINAHTPKEAYDLLDERLGKMQDYVITDVNSTLILEVVPYESEIEEKIRTGQLKPMEDVIESN